MSYCRPVATGLISRSLFRDISRCQCSIKETISLGPVVEYGGTTHKLCHVVGHCFGNRRQSQNDEVVSTVLKWQCNEHIKILCYRIN